MTKINFKQIAKRVIDEETSAIKKLKKTINHSFDRAVHKILSRKNGKVIFSGTGKSGAAGSILSSTFSSVGIPSFFIDANDAGHGSLGAIEKNDIVILISYSGETPEAGSIINFCKRRKITLIGIVSKKNSKLAKACDIKLIIPAVKEADPNSIVPTSSTLITLSIGHCLAIATMKYKKFDRINFKTLHPMGSLGKQLKTVEDLMIIKKGIPFINVNTKMKEALRTINKKKLGVVIIKNTKGLTKGIITDGDIKRASQKYESLQTQPVKKIMTKNFLSVDKDTLISKALSIMTVEKKITSLCVHKGKNKSKTIGIIHIHNILEANVS